MQVASRDDGIDMTTDPSKKRKLVPVQDDGEATDIDAAAAGSRKKQRWKSDEFKLTFTNPQSLKTLVDIVSNILTECHFQVRPGADDGDFVGIVVDSIDNKMVCMITARLTCQVEGSEGVFCVRMSTLNMLLRSVQPHMCMDISRESGNPEIRMCAYETTNDAFRSEFTINTLAREANNATLDDIVYEYTVEIDLVAFRQIVKMARDLKADDIRFVVEEPRKQQSRRHTYLKVIVKADDATTLSCYHTVTEWEGDDLERGAQAPATNVTIRTAEAETDASPVDASEMEVRYSEKFSVEYLSLFLKSMERHHLTIRLSSGKPLILHYPLGNEESHIRFVLAPKVE